MSDNDADVVLVTGDDQLQKLVARLKPAGVTLRCLTIADLKNSNLPRADQCWLDLDAGTVPEIEHYHRRVYFYSQMPENAPLLPIGMFIRKPCATTAVTVLWAGVVPAADRTITGPEREKRSRSGLLPAWFLDLHELDLREFCHKCVEKLPPRLGYAEMTLYLYDVEQNLLTLAETNSRRQVDLAIPLNQENDHLLAVVARSGKPLVTRDLVEVCRARRMRCPPALQDEPRHAALIAPLITRGKLHGLLQLNNRRGTNVSEVGLPFEHVFEFLARGLQHARQYLRARIEARVDRLTGLFNYRWMIEALSKEIRRSQRYGSALSLIMIDLDGLKSVNDRFGHLAGDSLLRHIAGKISAALRQIDSAARIGGDEFVVLLPATDLNGARHVARRILSAIRTDAPVIEHKPLPISASLGVAQWEKVWDETQFIAVADKAMYTAKREGNNRLVCHSRKKTTETTTPASVEHAK